MLLSAMMALAAASPACPDIQGVWMQGRGERILVMEQDACRLRGTVAEPDNQILEVRGFWTGEQWTMAATRRGVCATTAWGHIRTSGPDIMLINVRGTDGLCGAKGTAGAGPASMDATMTYRRVVPGGGAS